jgi:hypothetical protein
MNNKFGVLPKFYSDSHIAQPLNGSLWQASCQHNQFELSQRRQHEPSMVGRLLRKENTHTRHHDTKRTFDSVLVPITASQQESKQAVTLVL